MLRTPFLLLVCCVIPLLAGCGGTAKDVPKLGKVTGVITLDGKPLPKATVIFAPDTSRQSGGITDDQGKYDLMFNDRLRGAAVGKHKVRVTSGTAMEPEKIPSNFNTKTVLTADVKEGDNKLDFDLKTKPK